MKNLKYWMEPIPYLVVIAFILLGAYTQEIYTVKSRQIASLYQEIASITQELDDTNADLTYLEEQRVYTRTPVFEFPLVVDEFDGISSYFGYRNDPLRRNTGGTNNPFHNGIDMTGIEGARVHAVADGIVIVKYYEKGWHNSIYYKGHKYFNGYVEILHDDGMTSKLGHLGEILVHEGERVTAGQQIAQISEQVDPHSTGPHLDFRLQTENGEYVNPLLYVAKPKGKINNL